MQYREYPPHAILQDTVKCFWIHEETYAADAVYDIAPDGCVELIFNFGTPYVLLTTTPPTTLPAAVIVGFQDKTIPLRFSGTVKVVAARMFAWGALTLLQENAGALAHAMTPAGEGWHGMMASLAAHVHEGRYEQAAMALQRHLIQRALVRTYDPGVVQAAAKLLHHVRGQYRIEELADYCQTSVRQLQRDFKNVIGTSPKVFARTLRFESAQRRLMFEPDVDLTSVAYDCGYFDQAHFIKDFKAFTGKTPSEYAIQMREMQTTLKSKDVVFLQSPISQDG